MMTGRPLHEHRAGVNKRPYLDHRYPTIAEALRSEGYATGGFAANIFWCGRRTGLDRGFIHYEDYFVNPGDAITRTVLGRWLAYHVFPVFVGLRHSRTAIGREHQPENVALDRWSPRPPLLRLRQLHGCARAVQSSRSLCGTVSGREGCLRSRNGDRDWSVGERRADQVPEEIQHEPRCLRRVDPASRCAARGAVRRPPRTRAPREYLGYRDERSRRGIWRTRPLLPWSQLSIEIRCRFR